MAILISVYKAEPGGSQVLVVDPVSVSDLLCLTQPFFVF